MNTGSTGRKRLTHTQRKEVDQIILNAKLSGLSLGETQRLINERLNIMLSESWITHIRMSFKAECRKQIKRMSLDRYEFITHYMERIAEVKNLQSKYWEEYYKIKDPVRRIETMEEARTQTSLLLDLIEHLPLVTQHQSFDITTSTQAYSIESTGQTDIQPHQQQTEQPVF